MIQQSTDNFNAMKPLLSSRFESPAVATVARHG